MPNPKQHKLNRDDSRLKVKRILEITSAINDNKTAPVLYDIFKRILVEDLKIEHAAFLAFEGNGWRCVFKEGLSSWSCDLSVIDDLSAQTEITSLGMAEK